MTRRLLNLLTTMSLLLCVAVVVLWVRSYRAKASVEFSRRGVVWEATSDRPKREEEVRQWKVRDEALLHACRVAAVSRLRRHTSRQRWQWHCSP